MVYKCQVLARQRKETKNEKKTGSGRTMDEGGIVVAIDQGTQSSRCILYAYNSNNKMIDDDKIAVGSAPVQQWYPKPGWVEQDPEALWDSVVAAVNEAVSSVSSEILSKVRAVGIANQRETSVVWDARTGKPLCRAIVWNDDRTIGVCARVASERGVDAYRASTGLPISTYFSAYKLMWMMENIPEVAKAVVEKRCMFGTVDSWLVYKLTGGKRHCTDVTNASRTGFMNLETLSWDPSILRDLGLESILLPEIVSSAEVIGEVESIESLRGAPMTGCLGDQQASMLGHRLAPTHVKNTYGTGCFVLMNTGDKIVQSKHGLVSTVAFKLGPDQPAMYALEGSIGSAGQGISWLKDSMQILSTSSESETLSQEVMDCGGVIFVPAFSGLLAPWWSASARASILGMTYSTTKHHIARAMLAAICFQTKDVIDAMIEDMNLENGIDSIVVDGGASDNNVLMQMQATVLGMPIRRAHSSETTAYGAALAAAIGASLCTSCDVLQVHQESHAATGYVFSPPLHHSSDQEAVNKHYAAWRRAVALCIDLGDSISKDAIGL